MKGHRRRETASLLAALTDGVVSRDLLQSVGISPADVRTEIAAGRWRRHGRQTVAVHTGPLGVEAERWRVVWETGSTISALDGVTALQVAGLRHFSDDDIHLSVVHTCAIRRTPGARLHKVIRRLPDELVDSSLPRTRAPVAALRAAYWAASDRQAALVLLMAVQQRLTTPEQLLEWSGRLRGRRRRGFIRRVLLDIACGVESLGELDFARLCPCP